MVIAAAIAGSVPTLASAELRICNQSFDVLNVALGMPGAGTDPETRGWWRIAPNQCATLVREPLHTRYYYVFATDVFGKEVLAGGTPLCVAPKRFDIDNQQDCLLRGFLDARFLEIDTQERDNWTVFVTPRQM